MFQAVCSSLSDLWELKIGRRLPVITVAISGSGGRSGRRRPVPALVANISRNLSVSEEGTVNHRDPRSSLGAVQFVRGP